MVVANLALSFVLELIGVGAFAYWGWQTGGAGLGRLALVIGAPVALIGVWALVVAPNASNSLAQPQRDIIGAVLLLLAAVLLAAAGQPAAAVAFAAVVLLNWVLLIVLGQDAKR